MNSDDRSSINVQIGFDPWQELAVPSNHRIPVVLFARPWLYSIQCEQPPGQTAKVRFATDVRPRTQNHNEAPFLRQLQEREDVTVIAEIIHTRI